MDTSGSVGSTNFQQMKTFVSELVDRLDIDSGNTRVGVVTYSTNVVDSIHLDDHSTVASLQLAIAALSYAGGWTYTNTALAYVRTSLLTVAAGDRGDAPNVVVVLTDGRSTDPPDTEVCNRSELFWDEPGSVGKFLSTRGKSEKRAFCFKGARCSCNVSMPYYFMTVYLPLTAPADWSYPFCIICNF